jgi:hypothetical protein
MGVSPYWLRGSGGADHGVIVAPVFMSMLPETVQPALMLPG